jgi:hypothetical protein
VARLPRQGEGWDGGAVLAGLDPDVAGLDPDALADRGAPSEAELYGEYPAGDDGGDDGFLAALAAGRGEAFAEHGPMEALVPGGALAGFSEYALDGGLGVLSDDALTGLLQVSRRLSAWQNGIELAAVAELDSRRLRESRRPGWSAVSEHIAAELAAALTLTGRSADALLGLARDLARLPAVRRALLAGLIDRARAAVFAAELSALGDRAANAAAAAVLPGAAAMTTGQLRAALRTLVLSIDPAAVRRRMARARGDARVEGWQEGSGNRALAGRELSPADQVAADRRITAIARALQQAGAPGTLDQLRAAVFTALLAGRDPGTLIPAPQPAPGAAGQDPPPGPGTAGSPSGSPAPGTPGSPDASRPRDGAGPPGAGTGPAGLAALSGTVHLTMPASTWLGLADLPGEAAGTGPLDAWTSRDLAATLAARAALARWCITLTRPDGTAAAHACARAGPGPPASTAARRAWLASQKLTWLDPGRCTHGSQATGYRPPSTVCHQVRARNRTCAFPGCRRPAARCDLDHTIPWDQGGPTCPCNLAPLCRQHHRTKQAPGWTLVQPEPGTLEWTTPHGRRYTVTPSTYLS